MIITAQGLLQSLGISKKQTLLADQAEPYFQYPMSMGTFFTHEQCSLADRDFPFADWMTTALKNLRDCTYYQSLCLQKATLREKIKHTLDAKSLHLYRMQIKEVTAKIHQVDQQFQQTAMHEYYRTSQITDHQILLYKGHLRMNSYHNLQRLFPATKALAWLQQIPIFTEGLADLGAVASSQIAVEGGPCLYGTDEVKTIIDTTNGIKYIFDYNSGQCLNHATLMQQQTFLLECGSQIVKIQFVNEKDGLSSQELELFCVLFGVAEALQCPLLLSLPDMSYLKYFQEIVCKLPEDVKEEAIKNYITILYRITDLYLEVADIFKNRFHIPHLEILHKRNTAIYQKFLTARQAYFRPEDLTTKNQYKRAALYDYLSFPAAPYYLWGIKNILEINSTDETDAVRKCQKAHKQVIQMHQLMLPEKVSADGKTTVFEASRALKGYCQRDEVERKIECLTG